MTDLGLYFATCRDMELAEALEWAASLEITTIEISSHVGGRFDVDEMRGEATQRLRAALDMHGIRVSAINMSADGQLLLGPHASDTDGIHAGTAEAKRAFAERRLRAASRLAVELGAGIVSGFVGCEDYSRWFPWPERDAWERMEKGFAEAVTPILDDFDAHRVRFAIEPHPRQLVYNTETAVRSVELLDGHPAWGFTLDPANLMLAGADPVVFVSALGGRVLNFHAKDGELVSHHAARSGLLANGPWERPGRGFRFRIPGWGDVRWKQLITELNLAGYTGPLTIEHEDPTFSAREGVEKAAEFLMPLRIASRPDGVWW